MFAEQTFAEQTFAEQTFAEQTFAANDNHRKRVVLKTFFPCLLLPLAR